VERKQERKLRAGVFGKRLPSRKRRGAAGASFFGGGKRRLSDTDVRDLSWRDLESSCLSHISSLYVNEPNWGLLCTPEAIECRQTAACPFADSEDD